MSRRPQPFGRDTLSRATVYGAVLLLVTVILTALGAPAVLGLPLALLVAGFAVVGFVRGDRVRAFLLFVAVVVLWFAGALARIGDVV